MSGNDYRLVRTGAPAAVPIVPSQMVGQCPDPTLSGGLLDYWPLLLRRKLVVTILVLAGFAAGVVFTMTQIPVYRSRVILEIQALREGELVRLRDAAPAVTEPAPPPELDLNTQVKLLQSRALVERAAERAGATERPGPPGVSGRARGLSLRPQPPASPPSRAEVVESAPSALHVRVLSNTRIVEIAYDSANAQFSADFANAIAEEFIKQKLESRFQSSRHTRDWLGGQMRDLKLKLEQSESALRQFTRRSGLLFTSETDNVSEQRLKQVQQELVRAQADRIAKESRLAAAMAAAPESLQQVLEHRTLQEYQARLTDLKREEAEARSMLTAAHPRVIKLKAQIDELQSALDKEKAAVVESIRTEYEAARRREELLAADYRSQAALLADEGTKVSRYRTLKQEVDMTRQLYDSMLERVKEADLASALRASSIRIVDPAETPKRPYSPRLMLNAALGLFAGLLLGLGLAVVLERADRCIRQPGDVPYLPQAREIAIIPSIAARRSRRLLGPARDGRLNGGGAIDSPAAQRPQAGSQAAFGPAARSDALANDTFCVAVTSILFSGANGQHPRVIVVTSASPAEGKSFVSSNLATALAGVGVRVLLIDGDLRKPSLHETFGAELTPGFADALRLPPGAPPDGFIRHAAVANLDFLPAGSEAPSSLLYTPQLPELLRRARTEYEIVLIDSPPVLQMPDARVLGKHSDAVVFVIRSGQTTREATVHACRMLFEDGTRILGTILNDWNPERSATYGYYYKKGYGGRKRSGAGGA